MTTFVSTVSEYGATASGAYSARKQYVPGVSGANVPEVAVPSCETVTGSPTGMPPDVQSGVPWAAKHAKKETVPLIGPLSPLSVALSLTDPPDWMEPTKVTDSPSVDSTSVTSDGEVRSVFMDRS